MTTFSYEAHECEYKAIITNMWYIKTGICERRLVNKMIFFETYHEEITV